ncbi:MAG: hypothetical protein V1764_02160 [Nitrospirota bacterium]
MVFLICFPLFYGSTVDASWEIGTKAGFDSNVDRAIDDGRDDVYLSAYTSFNRNPSGESRLDWSFAATIEGTTYKTLGDLGYAEIVIAPGIVYYPNRSWNVTVSPFFQAKGVRDSDQSAIAFGGKVSMRQQLWGDIYLGQYFIYKDSSAKADVYSFSENAVGVYAGVNWTSSFFSEIGYEYSHGDSFRSIDEYSAEPAIISTSFHGRGRHRYMYSSAFGEFLIREPVDRNAIGFNAGFDLGKSLSSLLNYTFTKLGGDLGSSESHSGFVGLGYRF